MSSPADLSRILQDVRVAFQGGDHGRALVMAEQAVDGGIEHPNLLVLAAHHNLQKDDAARAHRFAARAGELAPDSADVQNVLGLALLRLERARDALDAFEAGLRASPGLTALYHGKAQAHEALYELDQIQGTLQSLLALNPQDVDALAWMADLATKRDDLSAARGYAARALALQPHHHGANITLAVADVADKNYAAAEQRLSALLPDPGLSVVNRAFAQSVLGDALDGLDRTEEAFAHYTQAKAALRRHYAAAAATSNAIERVARLTTYFRNADAAAWSTKRGVQERPETRAERGPSGATKQHVFLVGFPRSGTTLLEQVLAGHPDVEAMEERDAFETVIRDFTGGNAGFDRFAALSEAELEPYRAAYWSTVARFGHKATAPVFIDKMPLNTLLLPVIARLFPDAKILFALRDPRDVVLSCFRRRFGMTRQMYEFTTLQSAAAYYDAVMELAEIYRAKLDLDLAQTRHEDLLADLEGEAGRLCAFLGLEWRDEMKDFARRARQSTIHTPSGAQVARGLSSAGKDQWRRYAQQMTPVLPGLAPWVARFGYERTI